MILCSCPKAQYEARKKEIDDAVARVFDSGWYVLGEEVRSFEREFAQYIGVKNAVGVGSGTEALHIALRSCGVKQGDEVITASHTAVATVAAIELCGAQPVLVDIEPEYFVIDPKEVERAMSPRTKAIVVVHIYGQPANLIAISKVARKHSVKLIEDCAQAVGAVYKDKKAGAWSDMACFSFYPTKNLGAIGDGGAIVTNNDFLADKARRLREYGWDERRNSQSPGLNSRLDEVQAAILRVKLKYLDEDNEKRRELARAYTKELSGLSLALPGVRQGALHAYHLYVVRLKKREALREFLKKNNIQASIHYPEPVHEQAGYSNRVKIIGKLSETKKVCSEILSLPMYPELKVSEQEIVIETIKKFFKM